MDLSKTGLDMFFKPYQITALKILWDSSEPLSSRTVWEEVNKNMAESISRASIINFLNDSVELGILDFIRTTGKGGYRRLYSAKFSRVEIKSFLSKKIQKHLQTLP
jgi:Fe2+ or Zn2+ uptake regulation protein